VAVKNIEEHAKVLNFEWAKPIVAKNEQAWGEWQEAAAGRLSK
jgi:hypothetical protein